MGPYLIVGYIHVQYTCINNIITITNTYYYYYYYIYIFEVSLIFFLLHFYY
jgi:hypothetical protein